VAVAAVCGVLIAAAVIRPSLLTVHTSKKAPAAKTAPTQPTTTATATSTATASEAPVPTSRPSVSPYSSDGSYAVGTTSLVVVDPVPAGAGAGRSLPTAVFYPGHAVPAGEVPPDTTHAPYPLLVFSEGYNISVHAYSALLGDWASAGFVVAAPTYPDTEPAGPGALNENDITNHPADLRQVITTVLATAREPGSVLSGLVDANEIGVVGQSDGADVSLAVAANSCCHDPRVKAAAILSGAELASFGGNYQLSGRVPLLVTQGDADTINLPGCSAQIYDAAGPPKFYLDLLGAPHLTPYVGPGPDLRIVANVTTEFFDGELAGQTAALAALTTDGNVVGGSTLTTAPATPQPGGQCPGAPG